MQLDGALIALNLSGLALAPLWAWLWTRAMLKRALPRLTRTLGVVALSILTLFTVSIGPSLMLAGNHGLLSGETADSSVVVAPRPRPGAINQLK